MKLSIRIPVLALMLCVALPAQADSLFGFSYFGGDARMVDARTEALGGAGIARRDSLNASVKIPTQLLDLRLVTVTVSGDYQSRKGEDSGGSVRRNDVQIPTFRVGFPIGRHVAAGFGFSSMRATQWTSIAASPIDAATIETKRREGTQFEIPFEFAVRLHSKLRLGAGLVYEGGTVRMHYSADNPSSSVNPQDTSEETLEALTWRLSGAVHDLGPLSLGAHYVPKHDADVSIDTRGVALDAFGATTRTDKRPSRWGMGAALRMPRRLRLAVDFEAEDWSQYEGRVFFDESDPRVQVKLRDESVLRLGLERAENARGSGLSARPIRVGYYHRRWNYALAGSQVTEWGLTVGTGLELRVPGARVDLALGYAKIGDLEENGAEEGVFRLMFSITGGEKWY